MDNLFLALAEAALLNKAGYAPPELFQIVKANHPLDRDLVQLCDDLIRDWEKPAEEDPLVAPFRAREKNTPEFLLARAFTELSDGSGMVEPYWIQCGQAYALQKAIKRRAPTEEDIVFAANLLAYFSAEHSIRRYFRALSPNVNWVNGLKEIPDDLPDFEGWARQFTPAKAPAFPGRNQVKQAVSQINYPELEEEISSEWEIFAGTLAAL